MKIDKQSSVYTIVYIIVLVLLVGCGLAFTSLSLRERQEANVKADTMGQILKSVHQVPEADVAAQFARLIVAEPIVNEDGEVVAATGASDVNVAAQAKLAAAERQLPLYVCQLPEGDVKLIVPLYGAGLWGPIWGYVALDADGSTIYGAYFNHQGETPGLGAEIEKPAFSGQFDGKSLFTASGSFLPVTVMKAGQKPADERQWVDAVSGGTITSKGVASMLDNCLSPYAAFLEQVRNKSINPLNL